MGRGGFIVRIWEDWLQSLPDKSFFNLYRNYLGPLSTPYHKPDLIEEFTSWMKQTKVQKRLVELLSEEDEALLSAFYLQKKLSSEDLSHLSTGSEEEMEDRLKNLEERLLLIPSDESFYVNPLLEKTLIKEGCLALNRVLNVRRTDEEPVAPAINDSLLSAVLIFINRERPLLLNNGDLNKRFIDTFSKEFENLGIADTALWIQALVRSLLGQGVLMEQESRLELCSCKTMRQWAALDQKVRYRDLIIALAPEGMKSEAWQCLSWFESNPGWAMHHLDWDKWLLLLHPGASREERFHWHLFGKDLRSLEVFTEKEGMWIKNTHWSPEPSTLIPPLIQPNGDINLLPESPFCWVLPYSTRLISLGSMIQCHLDRESFRRGCIYRLRAADWISFMEETSGHALDPLLRTRLVEWDKEFYSLDLEQLYLMKLSDDKKGMVKASGILDEYLRGETLDGDWLLSWKERNEWLAALEKLDILYYPEKEEPPWKKTDTIKMGSIPDFPLSDTVSKGERNISFINTQELDGEFDPLIQRELLSRQGRKVLLFKEQIVQGIIRSELRQASGFDFNSKIRLLEAALSPPAERLELTLPGKNGNMVKKDLDPLELSGKGESALLIGIDTDSNERIEIPVRRIIQLQRFPRSLI